MTTEGEREYHRQYYQKRRQRLIDYLGGECVKCGSTENLQFDHIDRADKLFDVKSALSLTEHGRSELDKCQLLCEPHHREKTIREKDPFRHGTMYGWMKKHCDCEACYLAKREWHDKRNEKRRTGARRPSGPRF